MSPALARASSETIARVLGRDLANDLENLVAGGAVDGLATSSGRAPAIANPAALELLLTLLRPEVVEALVAMVLGRNGARGVAIAGQPVPVAAVTNLIQALAEAASTTHHTTHVRRGVPRYLSEARRRGEDITAPEVRTAALLELIRDAWDDDLAAGDAG
ncbi:MAG: hypothetical protein KIT31_11080 [Deltaproteobacteria bacterium]|nr:hypothetical protein [Deltaproteobacteria bacterium]